jgi:hypothetical protein
MAGQQPSGGPQSQRGFGPIMAASSGVGCSQVVVGMPPFRPPFSVGPPAQGALRP